MARSVIGEAEMNRDNHALQRLLTAAALVGASSCAQALSPSPEPGRPVDVSRPRLEQLAEASPADVPGVPKGGVPGDACSQSGTSSVQVHCPPGPPGPQGAAGPAGAQGLP